MLTCINEKVLVFCDIIDKMLKMLCLSPQRPADEALTGARCADFVPANHMVRAHQLSLTSEKLTLSLYRRRYAFVLQKGRPN